mmetsp:Transcript_41236/g.46866  ORF Transcript_41236/g.46866 Transcript_41236/m.46866 type:complete len:190 (+) Transcript_41236:124-693(+)
MITSTIVLFLIGFIASQQVESFSFCMNSDLLTTRRSVLAKTVGAAGLIGSSIFCRPEVAISAPQIFNTPSGIKYAILKQPKTKTNTPLQGDLVVIEYTGYLANGQIWDSTHSEGKNNVLFFKLGSNVVVEGVNEMISNMSVGQKVQAIIPAKLGFGDKGLCLADGECLIKPDSVLVYDIYLKKSSIPPP